MRSVGLLLFVGLETSLPILRAWGLLRAWVLFLDVEDEISEDWMLRW